MGMPFLLGLDRNLLCDGVPDCRNEEEEGGTVIGSLRCKLYLIFTIHIASYSNVATMLPFFLERIAVSIRSANFASYFANTLTTVMCQFHNILSKIR